MGEGLGKYLSLYFNCIFPDIDDVYYCTDNQVVSLLISLLVLQNFTTAQKSGNIILTY